MHIKNLLFASFIVLIVLGVARVAIAPWDGVVDDPHRAHAIWIDPQNRTCGVGEIFVVDVLVNITSTPCEGLRGWDYKLRWNNTVLAVLKIDTHGDAKPSTDLLSGHTSVLVVFNTTIDLGDGRDQHWYGVSALAPSTGFVGVASVCTYTFRCTGYPKEGVSILDIREDKLVDFCTLISHTSSDGYVRVYMPDVNDDGIVDIRDIVIAALAFGSMKVDDPKTPWNETRNWNPIADLNDDDIVDICDLVIIGVNFGKRLPL